MVAFDNLSVSVVNCPLRGAPSASFLHLASLTGLARVRVELVGVVARKST